MYFSTNALSYFIAQIVLLILVLIVWGITTARQKHKPT